MMEYYTVIRNEKALCVLVWKDLKDYCVKKYKVQDSVCDMLPSVLKR